MRTRQLILLATTTTFTLTACEADKDPPAAGPEVVIETIGDTTIVRTLSGSVWGAEATLVPEVSIGELDGPGEYLFGRIFSIAADDDLNVYVFDHQGQHVRVYDSLGTYVETLGRQGEGRASSAAPRPSRCCRTPAGGPRSRQPARRGLRSRTWSDGTVGNLVGGLYSRSPLYTDVNGRTYVETLDLSRDLHSGGGFVTHLVVMGPDGTQVDTLPEPSSDHEAPTLTAEGGGTTTLAVPFSPVLQWTVHPSGHFLTGLPSEYRIDLARDDGVLRIERSAEPVSVLDEERATNANGSTAACGAGTRTGVGTARRYRSTSHSIRSCWLAATAASG